MVIRVGGNVSSIYRQAGESCGLRNYINASIGKVYINKYESIDIATDANTICIVINQSLSYRISVTDNREEFIDLLLKQTNRQDKIDDILS